MEQLSELAAEARDPRLTDEAVGLHEDLANEEERVGGRLRQIDAAFFAQIESVLAEFQLPLMTRLRSARQRQTAVLYHEYSTVSSALIDISKSVEELNLDEGVTEAVDPVLAEYEATVTPMIIRLDRAFRYVRIKGDYLGVEMMASASQPGPEAVARRLSALEARSDLRKQVATQQIRIGRVNRQFADRILPLLPEAIRESAHKNFLQNAYADVYPDLLDPAKLLAKLVAVQPNGSEDRESLEAINDAFQESYVLISRQMEQQYLKWQEDFARTFSTEFFWSYHDAIRALREKRWKLDTQAIVDAVSAGAAAITPELSVEVQAFLTTAKQAGDRAQTDDFPKP